MDVTEGKTPAPATDQSKYQIMPPLADDEYAALKASAAERGIDDAVTFDQDGNTVEGHNRKQIAEELGIDYPRRTVVFASEDDKYEYILEKNLGRRHMTREARDALIAKLNEEGWSIRRIADRFKVSIGTAHAATASVQKSNSRTVTGKDGRSYRVKPKATSAKRTTPAEAPKGEPDQTHGTEPATTRDLVGAPPVHAGLAFPRQRRLVPFSSKG